jgi:Zn finger protein HypA/HybF involved in hydrogenase expression
MKVVRVEATCTGCGHQWWTREVQETCPACSADNVTGWTRELEDRVIGGKTAGHTAVV